MAGTICKNTKPGRSPKNTSMFEHPNKRPRPSLARRVYQDLLLITSFIESKMSNEKLTSLKEFGHIPRVCRSKTSTALRPS